MSLDRRVVTISACTYGIFEYKRMGEVMYEEGVEG